MVSSGELLPGIFSTIGLVLTVLTMISTYQNGDVATTLMIAPFAAYFGYVYYDAILRGKLFDNGIDPLKILYQKARSKFSL